MKSIYLLFYLIVFINSCELFNQNEEQYYEIAYTSNSGDILLIDTEHCEPKVIVSTNNKSYLKITFLDNEHILFREDGDIYQSDMRGNKVNLTNTPFSESQYSIPKSGDKIIYTSNQDEINNDHRTEIYLLDFQLGNKQRLTYSKYCSSSPVISPDGNLFCFNSYNSLDSNDASLIVRDFDGIQDDTLNRDARMPVFSPDSRYVFYAVVLDGWYLFNIENHDLIRFNDGFYSKFSPNGEIIYFNTSLDNELVIGRINIDGTNKQIFDTGKTIQGRFDISPDGELIVFEQFEDYHISNIYTIDKNGKNLTKLVDNGHFPVFRPKYSI